MKSEIYTIKLRKSIALDVVGIAVKSRGLRRAMCIGVQRWER